MSDELDDLRSVLSEQSLTLQALQQAAADAEERHESSHATLLEMMPTLLKISRECEVQLKSGGRQRFPTDIWQGGMLCRHRWIPSNDGTESSNWASPADMDRSPAEVVFALAGDPGDNAAEMTSF